MAHVPARFLDRTTPPTLLTMILVTALAALVMNLFLPSLPAMAAHFDVPYGVMQIAVAGYLGVSALMQIVIGPVSDRYGRRATLLGALVVFLLATLGTLLSPTAGSFLAFRLVQAAVVTGMVLPRAAIRDMYDQDRAASMIGWVTMGMSVSPMVAPAIGGLLDGLFGWQANFVVMGILGLAGLALVYYDMGETAQSSARSLREQVAQYPVLLSAPRFWGYAITIALSSGAFFAYLGGAPYVGSEVYGLSPERLGVYFGAPAIGYFIGNGLSGRYSQRVGTNTMAVTGTLVVSAGLSLSLILGLAGLSNAVLFFAFMTFVGLGNGLTIPNGTAGMLSVRPHLAGTASGLGGAIMIGGGAALSALAGLLLGGGSSAQPLLWLMWVSSVLSVGTILYTVRREARLARAMPAAAE